MRLQRQLRAVLQAAITPGLSRHWFRQVDSALLRHHADSHPSLALKPLRPYLSLRWSRMQRMAAITQHYEIARTAPAALQGAMLRPEGLLLAQLPGLHGEQFELHLGYDQRFRKEGEWVLSVRRQGNHAYVIALSLTLARCIDGRTLCYIGSVQGAVNAQADIKSLTKALHGLRPATLLVYAAQRLAAILDATELRAVGRSIQVHRAKHLIHLPFLHALSFDYDRLWGELGGTRRSDGWFTLPLGEVRRARADMPANKRAQYLRRYALLDDLYGQISARCGAPPSCPPGVEATHR